MWWKDFFFFSRSQRIGIRIMLLLIVCFLLLPQIYTRLFPPSAIDIAAFREQVNAFESYLDSLKTNEERSIKDLMATAQTRERTSAARKDWSALTLKPFPFDPNDLPRSDWDAMGLPGRLINAIKNYEAAGGQFRFREDLNRIYLMRDEWYAQLEPYITLPSGKHAATADKKTAIRRDTAPVNAKADHHRETSGFREDTSKSFKEEARFIPFIVDINRADTSELIQIRGIGPTFARRIASYRNLLGGYHHPEQLLEVYGLDSNRWEQILPFVKTDAADVRQIRLNQAEFADLIRHPYINRNLANSLINLRNQHGPFKEMKEIKRSFLLCDSVYEKIRPYISLE